MASLIAVSGPPGAGKSTVSAGLAARAERSMLVEGDAFFGFVATGGIDPWLPESHEQNAVVTSAAGAATGVLAAVYDTVYDGVLGPWFLDAFLTATGCEAFDYVVLLPPVERCVERVRNRDGHTFDDENVTRQLHGQFAAGGIAERHLVDSSDLDPADTIRRIVRDRPTGRFRYGRES
ncbi:MAG: AAA family ATPase [Actinomycetota bacterium]